MDVIRYLDRIGIRRVESPSLAFLKKLQRQHLLNIPFENYDIHSRTRIELDTIKIFDKIINHNRGGFCYELNGLFYELLNEIGFKLRRVSGRVFHEGKYGREYDHLALIVTIESKSYLVDVGFGEFAFQPLEFVFGKELNDERGIYLFDKYDDEYFRINKKVEGVFKPEYIFKEKERKYSEFKEMCDYHQSNKESHFSKKKFITIPTEKGRITLSDNQLKVRNGDSILERTIDENEREKLLVTIFNFDTK